MANSSPWAITANKNVVAGYTETVCISCFNGFQTITKNNYIVTQSPLSCTGVLSLGTTPSSPSLFYNSGTTTQNVAVARTDFFTNS